MTFFNSMRSSFVEKTKVHWNHMSRWLTFVCLENANAFDTGKEKLKAYQSTYKEHPKQIENLTFDNGSETGCSRLAIPRVKTIYL